MKKTMTIAVGASFLLSSGCSSVPLRAGADFQAGLDFTQYATYEWDEPDERPTGDPRLDDNPFFMHRLHSAIHWELATRGIQYRSGGAQLSVHHHTFVRDRVEVLDADRNAGFDWDDEEGIEVFQYQEGTFLVDIADVSTKEIIWRGWATLDIGPALEDPLEMRDQIDRAIALMFESFPVPLGGVPRAPTGEGH